MKKMIFFLLFPLFLSGCSSKVPTFIPPPNIASEILTYYPTSQKNYIAITFDDGPNNIYTPRILDILEENDAKATFFLLGTEISEDTSETILRIYNDGHEIGNHSEDHKDLMNLTIEEGALQLSLTDEKIAEITGQEPLLVRPPFGAYSENFPDDYNRPFILWSVDPTDWRDRDAYYITQHILDNVTSGDIIVMHDRFESTADALEQFIPLLKARGYEFVTVSDLIEIYEGEIQNKIYKRVLSDSFTP